MLIFLAALIFAAYTDAKKQEIPIWVFPVALGIYELFHYKEITFNSFLSFGIVFVICLLMCLFLNMGGADAIMLSCMAFCFGLVNISIIILISSGICFLCNIKNKEVIVPFAPFVLFGYILFLLYKECWYAI